VIVLLSTGVFIIDLLVPVGAAVYIPYLIAIILSAQVPQRSFTLPTALTCTVLAVLGMVWSPPGVPQWMGFTNRTLLIGVIWVTAFLVRQRQQLFQALQEERNTLEQRVAERTAALAQSNTQLQGEIIARQQAQDALQRQHDLLQVTLTSIGDGVLTTDIQGRVTFLNPVAQQLTGWSADEALGRAHTEVFHIVHEHTRYPLETPITEVLCQEKSVSLANHACLLNRSGQEALIADSGAPIRDGQGTVYGAVLVFRDVTRTKQLEEELIKAEKLESVGILAAGIAHDFNNLLAVVMGNLSLLKLRPLPEEDMRWLTQAEDACRRATALTHQLLTFAKGGAPVRQPLVMSELLVEATQFAVRGTNVSSAFDLAADLWPADVDAGQMHQVIHNLVLNAVQAMPGGGMIQVQAYNYDLPQETTLPLPAGRYVRITVQDQGSGIAAQDLSRVFDPYFTTKARGSGLGLATAYAIVSKHDGYMTVTSEVGSGTTICLYLPVSQNLAAPVKSLRPPPLETLKGSGGRILVLDDEDLIRAMLQAMLTTLEYDVTCVGDGAAAIASYCDAMAVGKPYAAVILDLTIPGGMGGREVLAHLQAVDPEVKALVSSGYADDPVLAHYTQYGFQDALPKPYTIKRLSTALRRILSTTGGDAASGDAGDRQPSW
jgi:PAS domain S-box-containing protein